MASNRVSEIEDFVKIPLVEQDYNEIETSSDADTTALAKNDDSPDSQDNLLPATQFWNAFLLLTTFGYAIYSLLNIDHGMMRGWTQSEIAMRIPLDNWASYEASLNNKPIFTKTFINVIIYLLGDWLSQTIFAKKQILDFDASRTLRNGFIGLCFGPLVHLYYEFSDYILPVDVTINRLWKIGMDQTIYLSVKCSIYIIAVNMLAGESFGHSKETVKTKLPGVMFTAWKFWPLVHCVTYGVIPARHRILWVNSVDLVWNAILATQTSEKNDEIIDVDQDDIRSAALPNGSSDALDEKLSNEMELLQQEIFNQDSKTESEVGLSLSSQSTQVDLSSIDDTVVSTITVVDPTPLSENSAITKEEMKLLEEKILAQETDPEKIMKSSFQPLPTEIESELMEPSVVITDTDDLGRNPQNIFQELDSALVSTSSPVVNGVQNSTSVTYETA